MTQDEIDHLEELCYFLAGVQIRLLETGETIMSAHLGDVAFYEAVFHAGLRLPIHPTLRRILSFYNVCPT